MQDKCQSGRGLPQSKTCRHSRSVLDCGSPLPLFLAGVLWLTGCSTFNRDWKRASLQPQPTNGLAGRWEGFWISEHNGHNGRLRCMITPGATTPYDARFHAKYRKILSFGYTVPLQAQRSNDAFHFIGEANLGKLAGGIYRYEGAVSGTNLHSSYRSKYDYGYFRMNRAH